MQRTVAILMTSLRLRIPMAWKSVQLSIVMLWNAAVQSRERSRGGAGGLGGGLTGLRLERGLG